MKLKRDSKEAEEISWSDIATGKRQLVTPGTRQHPAGAPTLHAGPECYAAEGFEVFLLSNSVKMKEERHKICFNIPNEPSETLGNPPVLVVF